MDTQDKHSEQSPVVERQVITNAQDYREVSQPYRIYRSRELRLKPLRSDRIHCPMVDAARSEDAYGVKTLRDTSKQDLITWSRALGSDNQLAFLAIAYLSGPLSAVPRNIWTGRFDEEKINSGFITEIKDGINTGIIAKGYFDQGAFDTLISNVHPRLKGQTLDENCLYADAFSECYLLESELKLILTHNVTNQQGGGIKKFIGTKISQFEMGSLLLGLLSQPTKQKDGDSFSTTNAILVRDLFDLYKYGWFPAHIEEGFLKADLLKKFI